jgi:hypothetical protein
MEVLESIEVRGGRRVDLCLGDLTDLARKEWFDALVVSAFKGNYDPTPSAVIGALHRKGVSVKELATRPAVDYRQDLGTWLSEPLRAVDPGIGYERIVCFEPGHVGRPPEAVGHLFRALVAIVGSHPSIRTLAMPVLSTGDAGYSVGVMLLPLLDAAVNALGHGLPVDRIAVAVRNVSDATEARTIFEKARSEVGAYDVFVSYAHEDTEAREQFLAALHTARPTTRVFVDRLEIDNGAAWQRRIFESLDRCRRVVALLTPAYVRSPVCLEEFNIAWMRDRETRLDILKPLYVASHELPTYLRLRNYLDCREADAEKLSSAARSIADGLRD